jgi:hypothetical protein
MTSAVVVAPAVGTFSLKPAAPRWRNIAAAAAIVWLASLVANAEIAVQDWIPEVLVFPEDTEVVADRAVGSAIRMYSVTTEADGAEVLGLWQAALEQAGFIISAGRDDLLPNSVEFSGPGIINAKIVATTSPVEDGRTLIEFDATLD